jgi:hypothetical protein
MTTETIPMTLTPAAVALAAADLIEAQGLAHDHYYDKTSPLPPRQAPLDVLGAIAVVVGFEPHTWEDDRDVIATSWWRLALDTAEMLLDWLALSHDDSYADVIGAWSDERDQAAVVAELRECATGVLTS